MQISLSQDFLRKFKQHRQIVEQSYDPEQFTFKAIQQIATKTQELGTFRVPQPISYNQIIQNHENWRTNRYKLRNCRQPNLKIIYSRSFSKDKADSAPEMKQQIKSQTETFSIKKLYGSALDKYEDHEIADKLKLAQTFVKIAHKIRYRPHRRSQKLRGSISISGSKIHEKDMKANHNPIQRPQKQGIDLPQVTKHQIVRTPKLKRKCESKKVDVPVKLIIQSPTRPPPLPTEEESLHLSGWH